MKPDLTRDSEKLMLKQRSVIFIVEGFNEFGFQTNVSLTVIVIKTLQRYILT